MKPAGIFVFALTYLLISLRRLSWLGFDRPAGALVGAVLTVAVGVLTPEQALQAVDGQTLLLLFGVMGMGAFLALDGLFDELGARLPALAPTPARLLGLVVWSAGGLSALITNDAVCLLGTPLLVHLIRKHRLPPLPFLLGLATAANTGSVATLVGNPQNMLCATLGQLSYRDHLFWLGPVAVMGLAVNHGLLLLIFRRELAPRALVAEPAAQPTSWRLWTTLSINVAVAVACAWGAHLAWAATAGFVALMLIHRRDTAELWARIDWSILLFFAGLFVAVEGLVQSGGPALLFGQLPLEQLGSDLPSMLGLSGIFLVGSNIVSNVPFIVLVSGQMERLPNPQLAWELLAMASTFAGNLTLLGSVANIIVSEGARELGGIGFFQYLRVGLPVALLTTLLGCAWLVWLLP